MLERENGFLREIVATNEQKYKSLQESKQQVEEVMQQHQKDLQESYERQTDLQNQLKNLQLEHKQMSEYTSM